MRSTRLPSPTLLIISLFAVAPAGAQEEAEPWDVTAARGETYEVDFTTDEGSWMSVGVVYDADSLDEVWPEAKPYEERWWVDPTGWLTDDRPVGYWDRNR